MTSEQFSTHKNRSEESFLYWERHLERKTPAAHVVQCFLILYPDQNPLKCGWRFKEKNSKRFSSVQFSHWVVSDSLQHHGLKHARLPSSSPTLRVYSNSCPLSWWCHPTILSFGVPFSSCLASPLLLPSSFPATGSFHFFSFLFYFIFKLETLY